MKTRSGFVSNSSSSSFVVMGVRIEDKPLSLSYDDWDAILCGDKKYKISALSSDGEYIVGKVYADIHSDGDWMKSTSISIKDLISDSVTVKEEIKKLLKLDVEPTLLMGCRAC